MATDAWLLGIGGSTLLATNNQFTNTTQNDGPVCTSVLQYSGSTAADWSSEIIPIDSSKVYRISLWARQTGASLHYITAAFMNAAGAYITGGGTGWNSGTYHYWGRGNQPFPSAWTFYSVVFGPGQAFTAPAGAKFIRLAMLQNYGSTATDTVYMSDYRIEEVLPSTLIQNGAIVTDKLAANAVTAAKIAANTITANEIAASTITSSQIAADTILAGNIAAGAIGASEIAADAVTAVKIFAGAVEADKIATNAVTADKIAANAITAGKIAAGSIATNALVVTGRGAAINDDPLCQDPTAWKDGGHGTTATRVTITDAPSGDSAYRSNAGTAGVGNSGGSGIETSKLYPVSSSKKYRLTAFVRNVGGAGVSYLRLVDQVGNQIFISNLEGFAPPSTWTRYSGFYQPSASVKSVRLRAILNWTGTTGYQEVTDFRLEEMAEADLIVDGAIVATKIAADAVTANKISAGSIVSSKLAIGDTSNMYPDPDFVDASAYSTANGTFSLVPTDDAVASKNYLYTGTTNNEFVTIPKGVPVEPGKFYYFACSAFTSSGGNAWCYISWQSMNAAGAQSEITITTVVNGTVGSLTKGAVVAQAPSNARRAVMVFRNLGTSGQNARFGEPIIRRAMQGELVVDGTITATKIATSAVEADKIAANAVTAGKIAANAITADKIASNSITTSKLLVTGTANAINDDPMFQDPSAWELTVNTSFLSGTGEAGAVANTYIGSSVGTDQQNQSVKSYPIGPGKRYRLSANLYASAGNARNIYLYVEFYDQNGAYIGNGVTGWGGSKSGYTYGAQPPTGVWTRQGGQFGPGTGREIPVNTRSVKIGVWFNYSVGSGLVFQGCQDLRLEEVVEADIIADGAIIANKVAANAITAEKINANAVTADKINAGAVTAAKIGVTALSAITANVGELTAGVIRNAGDTYRVDVTNGRTIVRTGGYIKVTGAPFGSSSQFIEWYGPDQASLATCTEANAVYYLKTNGSAYFGGTLAAGIIRNSAQTTDTSATATIPIGPFSTNGGTKTVVVSYSYLRTYSCNSFTGSISGAAGSAVVIIEKSVNGGAWTQIGTLNAPETQRSVFVDGEPGIPDQVIYAIGGSTTLTDNTASTTNLQMRGRLTTRTLPTLGGTNITNQQITQNISITSTE
jgi:hypothetical protein